MPTNIPNRNGTDGGEICVATQQKAIYNWYQSRHSDDEVVDIYSPRWQERIMGWYTWCISNFGSIKATGETVKSWRTLEEIDFRVFFFAHPVVTFSLWHVLQAFYEIDESVCGTASDAQVNFAKWRDMRPFEYLKSKAVKRKWEIELKKLDKEIEYGTLAGEELKLRIFDIQDGVEKLEVSLASLEQDMDVEQSEIAQADEILTFIRNAIDGRCNLIVKLLKVGNIDADMSSAENEIYNESLGNFANISEVLKACLTDGFSIFSKFTWGTRCASPTHKERPVLELPITNTSRFVLPHAVTGEISLLLTDWVDSFNFQSNDFMYYFLFLAFLGLAGVKGLDFVSRNYI